MEPWQITLSEWVNTPRTFAKPPRLMNLFEWRQTHGYPNPVDDHGFFRFPNGITKSKRRWIDKHVRERAEKMIEGCNKYEQALAAGEVPMVVEHIEIRCDGLDMESHKAAARVVHRRSVMKAYYAGQTIPPEVLEDYRVLLKLPPS